MTTSLPTKLKKEPLIDVIFEVRFESNASTSDILPGILYGNLSGNKRISRHPIAEIPKSARDRDLNLKYAPLVSVHMDNYVYSVSDNSLLVGCNLPYRGWNDFKKTILEAVTYLDKIQIVKKVDRFSLKYVDLIPSENIADQLKSTKFSISLDNQRMDNNGYSLKLTVQENDILHLLGVTVGAQVIIGNQSQRKGVLVDVDSIINLPGTALIEWLQDLPENLDQLHLANKAMFFKCLDATTIEQLEPEYD